MLPWNLLKSSNNFTSYLSAYSVFLSSIAGVMVRFYPLMLVRTANPSIMSRLRNTISFDVDTTVYLTFTAVAKTVGTGILLVSTFGK